MQQETVLFKKAVDGATVPTYATDGSAGADLYAYTEGKTVTVDPGRTVLIRTGVCVAVPQGFAGMIFARSGLATKRGLAPANKVGVIDSDYRGEILVPLHNHSEIRQTVESGERIAQLVFLPYLRAAFQETDRLDPTERATGGFGSTGAK